MFNILESCIICQKESDWKQDSIAHKTSDILLKMEKGSVCNLMCFHHRCPRFKFMASPPSGSLQCGTNYPFISVFFRETMSYFLDKMISIGP